MIRNLSQQQLAGILETIPIEFSFVDENNLVRFWNKHETRIFERPMYVMGEPVWDCHAEQSVDKVNRLLSDPKAGKRDSAQSLIELKGRKILIRYFAVPKKAGRYLGTLETTQDITEIRKLEGKKGFWIGERGRNESQTDKYRCSLDRRH